MARNALAQPALYLDSPPTVTESDDLFTVEFSGVSLKLTPFAMTGLVARSVMAAQDWGAISRARKAGILVDDTAEVIAFPKTKRKARKK